MQYRAVITDADSMKEFLGIIQTLSKLGKECVVRIGSNKMVFSLNEDSSSSSPFVWAEIDTISYFSEYDMRGGKNRSEILLSINPVNFARALVLMRSSAKYCKIKLANIDSPCFDVSIEIPSFTATNQSRYISHYVPVEIIPPTDWDAYKLPKDHHYNTFLTIPSTRVIRSLIEKKKNLSPTIVFSVLSNGQLNIVTETEFCTVTTCYVNLEIKDNHGNAKPSTITNVEASCPVDCKKAAMFLGALQIPNLEISCGLIDGKLVKLQSQIRSGVMIHCIMPAVYA